MSMLIGPLDHERQRGVEELSWRNLDFPTVVKIMLNTEITEIVALDVGLRYFCILLHDFYLTSGSCNSSILTLK